MSKCYSVSYPVNKLPASRLATPRLFSVLVYPVLLRHIESQAYSMLEIDIMSRLGGHCGGEILCRPTLVADMPFRLANLPIYTAALAPTGLTDLA